MKKSGLLIGQMKFINGNETARVSFLENPKGKGYLIIESRKHKNKRVRVSNREEEFNKGIDLYLQRIGEVIVFWHLYPEKI